uniref:hypothetical protein n=1 Tax=Sediminispirochaeta bajacaliforniensis TaxID=148 RepID=UPI0003813F44
RAEEGDFCGVYDKKLLWRANLYIGERGEDWNDTHPWNSEENEWNKSPKSLNGSDPDPSRMYTSAASDWVDGEGGQVIKIATYTPVRNYPGSNKVIGRVAYDYPANSDESYNNRVGVNSPFEFNRRMLDQQSKMETGEAIATIWPPDGYTMEGMAEWGSTAAPGTSGPLWNNYRKNPVANEYPGLPGIGLYFEDPAHATINDPKPTFPEIVDKDLIEHIGVDCVGFAKRAAGYSRDPYTWTNYPEVSWSGGSVHDPELIRSEGYPHEAKKSYVIISREGIKMSTTDTAYFTSEVDSEDGPSEEEFKKIQKEFLSIRSGDIIHYGTSHIGIIETIDVEALSNARTIVQLMTAVTTIESVYGSSVNFVIKRNMMEGLSGVTAVFNKAGSWHYDWDKDLRSWSIERLKVN